MTTTIKRRKVTRGAAADLPNRLRKARTPRSRPTTANGLSREYTRPAGAWRPGHYDGPLASGERREEAKYLATGGDLVPPIYRRNPGACLVLLYKAQALDVPTAVALENVHWNGTIGKGAMSAQLMAALLRRAGYDYVVKTENTERVEMHVYKTVTDPTTGATRRKRLTPVKEPVTWTMSEAVGAGLAWRDLWQSYPTDMLWARCLMRAARRYASEVGTGLAYTVEELHDMALPAAPGDGPVHADVQALLERASAEGVTPADVRKVVADAKKAKLLDREAGSGETLGQVLGQLAMDAFARQADQVQATALPAAGHRPDPTSPCPDVVLSAPAGAGNLECGCPSREVLLAGGKHREGCPL